MAYYSFKRVSKTQKVMTNFSIILGLLAWGIWLSGLTQASDASFLTFNDIALNPAEPMLLTIWGGSLAAGIGMLMAIPGFRFNRLIIKRRAGLIINGAIVLPMAILYMWSLIAGWL